MSDNRRIVRIFLASPGDLSNERKIASEVVNELNKTHSAYWKCNLELFGWEDTISQYGRPQEIINRELDQCELFIGMLWKRWGTPPDNDGHFTSGFEEEFVRATDRMEQTKKPFISLMFKKVHPDLLRDPGVELKKVLDFRQNEIDKKRLIFQEFDETQEFERKLSKTISQYIYSIIEKETTEDPSSITTENNSTTLQVTGAQQKGKLFDSIAYELIQTICAKDNAWDATTSIEIARFRLLAASLRRVGNDDSDIGIHDAFLIFLAKEDITLSKQEVAKLLETGIAKYWSSYFPLWYWLSKTTDCQDKLSALAIFKKGVVCRNALRILEILNLELRFPSYLGNDVSRAETIRISLEHEKEEDTCALIYHLANFGRPEDVGELKYLLTNESRKIREAASTATIQILSRNSIDHALKRATEPDIEELNNTLVRGLFEKVAVVQTETLRACLQCPSRILRHMAARTLVSRNALSIDEIQTISSDPSPTVSITGFIAAKKRGVKINSDSVSKTLNSLDNNEINTPICWQTYQSDITSRSQINLIITEYLFHLEVSELEIAERDDNWIATIVRFKKKRTSSKKELIETIHKRSSLIKPVRSVFPRPSASDLLGLTIPKFMENSEANYALCQSAINTLCSFNNKNDLEEIRELIRKPNIKVSRDVLNYFEKHGCWDDIALMEEKAQLRSEGITLALQIDITQSTDRELGKLYYKLGRDRIGDLLNGSIRESVIPYLVANIPIRNFAELQNEMIETLLRHNDGNVRIASALQVVRSMSTSQIKTVTKQYSEESQKIYYDTCQWLDLGCSFSRKIAKSCAQKELQKRYL
ncbi:DUF4062 domain-containing protein [Thalassospira lucentensis]|uniref:DUF4062 domain-containing protein n=1 Tax=Thalassospira lucentensis TaxID=168935 RepID=UPI0003B670D8|nr:DUF4062 domain-containing protein [Thalassospira lucentensis]RCK29393.1 hypothetical protein TH1_05475 [Thalassospira lucentensis MCCC 1A00383 = DSM 14000]